MEKKDIIATLHERIIPLLENERNNLLNLSDKLDGMAYVDDSSLFEAIEHLENSISCLKEI